MERKIPIHIPKGNNFIFPQNYSRRSNICNENVLLYQLLNNWKSKIDLQNAEKKRPRILGKLSFKRFVLGMPSYHRAGD